MNLWLQALLDYSSLCPCKSIMGILCIPLEVCQILVVALLSQWDRRYALPTDLATAVRAEHGRNHRQINRGVQAETEIPFQEHTQLYAVYIWPDSY